MQAGRQAGRNSFLLAAKHETLILLMRCLKTHTNMLMRSRQAWGLNTLFFDLCTAPFVLILEEDWMYMDEALVESSGANYVTTTSITCSSSRV